VKPVLLRADYHSWAHESHERNDLICRESVSVDQIGTDQTACATQTSLAVDSNSFLLYRDHFVCHFDEFLDQW
jgi:hypothetical protein